MAKRELLLRIGQQSDTGPTRQSNEDYVAHCVPEDQEQFLSKGAIFLVADGMGGHRAGEVASREAVLRVQEEYYRDESADTGASLVRAIETANRQLHELAEADPEQQGMGTTLVVAVIKGRDLVVANVGDSRAYLLRGRRPKQITRDHSWVEEQIQVGLLTRTQADRHPQRNLITRALGIKPEVDVDLFRDTLRPKDRLLLCTDGLSGALSDLQMARIAQEMPPEEAAAELIRRAADQSGTDNASVILICAEAPSRQLSSGDRTHQGEAQAGVTFDDDSMRYSLVGWVYHLWEVVWRAVSPLLPNRFRRRP